MVWRSASTKCTTSKQYLCYTSLLLRRRTVECLFYCPLLFLFYFHGLLSRCACASYTYFPKSQCVNQSKRYGMKNRERTSEMELKWMITSCPMQDIGSSLVNIFGKFLANQSDRSLWSLWQVLLALVCFFGRFLL